MLSLSQHHRFAQQQRISLAQLRGEKFILPPRSLLHGLREQFARLCSAANCQPVAIQEVAWITTVLSLVSGNMGVGLLPENATTLHRASVIYRDIQESSPILERVAVTYDNDWVHFTLQSLIISLRR